jgi:hypothetical protein
MQQIRNSEGNVVGIVWPDKAGKFPEELAKLIESSNGEFSSEPVGVGKEKAKGRKGAMGKVEKKNKKSKKNNKNKKND